MPFPSTTLFPTFLTRRKSSSASASTFLSMSPTDSAAYPESFVPPPPLSGIVSSNAVQAGHGQRRRSSMTPTSPSTSRLRCARCLADLALTSQIISKGFNGRWGRAFLVAPGASVAGQAQHPHLAATVELPNTYAHRPTARNLVTGLHTVADIGCSVCGAALGWKYIAAEAEEQRYKVGNFILEERRVVNWGGGDAGEDEIESGLQGIRAVEEEGVFGEVEFNSADEEECEELFLGTWDRVRVGKRRAERLRRRS